MPTAKVIVKRSLRLAGIVEAGVDPTTTEFDDGLEALNDLLALYSAKAWIIPYRTRDADIVVAVSKNIYSIGTGGDFSIGRPIRIDSIVINSGDNPHPVRERTLDHYNAHKITSVAIPDFFYYEPVYPLGLIYFPTQLDTGVTVTIDSLKPFTSFSDIDTSIDMPPGYEAAIKPLLAIHLAPEYNKTISRETAGLAERAEDFMVTQSNLHRKRMSRVDSAIVSTYSRGRFDIVSGR